MKILNEGKILEITYKMKGLIFIKYTLYLVMVIGPIYNLFKFVLPENDELKSIILKGLAGGAFWIIIALLMLNYIKQHIANQDREIIFDNNKRQLKDDEKVYSYDDIENISVVPYSEYLNCEDERAIDGTTVRNYKLTYVARIELKNNIVIAIYIGTIEKCEKTIIKINNHINS